MQAALYSIHAVPLAVEERNHAVLSDGSINILGWATAQSARISFGVHRSFEQSGNDIKHQ